ncbi:hypothetical protein Nans01_18770 [Nocardiopsis ansamitocini]|uniref:Uncharacterized protein n=2 Tax=Nocardiopsis ansamitocini TaxID=1670832 RepID=A0A9W6P5N5_9ACTN|nr:hypothetical protein Nans01_18770 [Nocardiopsis ansamitocini]
MPTETIGDSEDDGISDGQPAVSRCVHLGARDRECAKHHGVLISLANSAPVREGRDLDCPTSDTHAPYLLFHRQRLPNSAKQRPIRTVVEAR